MVDQHVISVVTQKEVRQTSEATMTMKNIYDRIIFLHNIFTIVVGEDWLSRKSCSLMYLSDIILLLLFVVTSTSDHYFSKTALRDCVETIEYDVDFHKTIVILLLLECGCGDNGDSKLNDGMPC